MPAAKLGGAARALAVLKKEFPAVPIETTCFDKAYGVGNALGNFGNGLQKP